MVNIGERFYKNSNTATEEAYRRGVNSLESQDYYKADEYFRIAAAGDHASAIYNLFLIHASGNVSPYQIDFAVENFIKAASLGHPKAIEYIEHIDSADRGAFGTIALAMFAERFPAANEPHFLLMMWCCRYYKKIAESTGATDEIIAYELDAASASEHDYIQRFVARTRVPDGFYRGGLAKLTENSPADQMTDGLNNLYVAMKKASNSEEICLFTRCSIVVYIIQYSRFASNAQPLLGIDRFF